MTQYDNALDIGWALKAYYYFRNNLFTVMYDRFCLALAAAPRNWLGHKRP